MQNILASREQEKNTQTYSSRLHSRHRFSYPPQSNSMFSSNQHSPLMRPRGPDVGKSIHKAAEASEEFSRLSLAPSPNRRRSLNSTKRITPSLPRRNLSDNETLPHDKGSASPLSNKGDRFDYSPLSKSKVLPSFAVKGAKPLEMTADQTMPPVIDHPLKHGLEVSHSNRNLTSEDVDYRIPRFSSPRDSTTSTSYQPQFARKSCSRKATSTPGVIDEIHNSILQGVKAARKRSAQYTMEESSSSSSSEHTHYSNFELEVSSDSDGDESDSSLDAQAPVDANKGAAVSVDDNQIVLDKRPRDHPDKLKSPLLQSFTPTSISDSATQRRRIRRSSLSPLTPTNLAPPSPLISAFDTVSAYTVHLQVTGRLPFLLRNVRAGFRACCKRIPVALDSSILPSHGVHEANLQFEYVDPSGKCYAYDTVIHEIECPLCSVLGILPSWEALKRHVLWDHREVELEAGTRRDSQDGILFLIVRLNVRSDIPALDTVLGDKSLEDVWDQPLYESGTASMEMSSESQSRGASENGTSGVDSPPLQSPTIYTISSSQIQLGINTSDILAQPRPPPGSNLHGPSLPILAPSGNPHSSTNLSQPTTYRPTGPHLYDRLPPLPQQIFGPLSWFIIDKEEEIFELTDVLDEDKVMCALWARWILFNRPAFISNYLRGVEAFVEEYWLVIHQAAGWGALRVWLLMLVSKRFLKNIEMVQVLKKYNTLVGKDDWPKMKKTAVTR